MTSLAGHGGGGLVGTVTGVTVEEASRTIAQLLAELQVVGVESAPVSATPPTWVTADGALIEVSKDAVRIVAGVQGGLQISSGLLQAVAAVNQHLHVGQVWVAAGADDRHWNLIWQVTFPFVWATPLGIQRCVYTSITGRDEMLGPTIRAVRLLEEDRASTLNLMRT